MPEPEQITNVNQMDNTPENGCEDDLHPIGDDNEMLTDKDVLITDILTDIGREANHDLNFRLWSKSKHAQYFTPLRLANIICSMVGMLLPDGNKELFKKLSILDPTCGTGRLLYPFKRNGANCIGIEFDKEPYDKAKQLIGKDSIRHGSILDYAEHLKDRFDVAITNPPYGILWNQEETEFEFEGLSYAKNIESQNATLQICQKALKYNNHFLFAIIPT